MTASPNAALRQVISADQIQKRVRELGRQISDDYRGQTLIALGILENGFMFIADLVRALEVPVVCTFIKPRYKESKQGEAPLLEIFFSHELPILLCSTVSPPGVYLCSPIISDSWWMKLSCVATAWAVRSRRGGTCRTWQRLLRAVSDEQNLQESNFLAGHFRECTLALASGKDQSQGQECC